MFGGLGGSSDHLENLFEGGVCLEEGGWVRIWLRGWDLWVLVGGGGVSDCGF